MAKGTDLNFDYIPGQRYIIEIKDKDVNETLYSRRICTLSKAIDVKSSFNKYKTFDARILDTKTGDVI